ncbi:hypothetical protein DFH08DRAFT_821067 [Mycena albidolilacea]|uniref:Uncharacterized protein n=1 Tax=Mycena albidolilacea TaxID=1033008 RepID=A0AAD7EDV9_9AGAR|nr:hypothetical protein DFH08DRAFT_821067 [Mycena albidolilacea]
MYHDSEFPEMLSEEALGALLIARSPDAPPSVQCSSTRWAVADYVRLDSPVLAKLISAGKKGAPGAPEVVQAVQPSKTLQTLSERLGLTVAELHHQLWSVHQTRMKAALPIFLTGTAFKPPVDRGSVYPGRHRVDAKSTVNCQDGNSGKERCPDTGKT